MWKRYIEPVFRDRVPTLITDKDGKQRAVHRRPGARQLEGLGVAGAIGARDGVVCDDTMEYSQGRPGGFDPHKRMPDMDVDGIDAAFPYPTLGLFGGAIDDPELAAARCSCRATTAGSPTTASRIPTACSAWRCCRCNRSSWRSRR